MKEELIVIRPATFADVPAMAVIRSDGVGDRSLLDSSDLADI